MSGNMAARRVFITGGTGSVGRALVAAFRARKDAVTFQFHGNQRVADEMCSDLGVEPIQLDLSGEFELPRADFDVVVNNAGINISDVSTHEVSLPDWSRTLTLNVTAPFRIIRQCLPTMMQKRWGRIINISSIYGLRAVEGRLPYTVSKHALAGLTKTIAKEYAPHGITCNEICPGPIDSDMLTRIVSKEAADSGTPLAECFREICEGIPAGRLANVQEIASLAVFLASDEAGYLNGASIPIDGGMIV